jgi:N-acetylglucosaminyldiphosphoundecaprenol N-acetyl-beta-D-mannosaminyltransferase
MAELAAIGLERPRIKVENIWFDSLTASEVIKVVREGWSARCGGSIITVNIDIARAISRNPELGRLVSDGSLVVADGMPMIWAARAAGTPLPERVPGSSLVFSLSEAAAVSDRSVFLLGGAEGVPDKAAEVLQSHWPKLRIAGTYSPPFGFDQTDVGIQRTVATVAATTPDLVLVGLGFPRQERLIEQLLDAHPTGWYLACGGGITMAAGIVRRASPLIQRVGLEWAHRLALEPRRLARRYLRDDLPFALGLLAKAPMRRFTARR